MGRRDADLLTRCEFNYSRQHAEDIKGQCVGHFIFFSLSFSTFCHFFFLILFFCVFLQWYIPRFK